MLGTETASKLVRQGNPTKRESFGNLVTNLYYSLGNPVQDQARPKQIRRDRQRRENVRHGFAHGDLRNVFACMESTWEAITQS